MNNIIPSGFEIVHSDDFITRYRGVVAGHCIELGKVTYKGRTDWTCEIDGTTLFAAADDRRAKVLLEDWWRTV